MLRVLKYETTLVTFTYRSLQCSDSHIQTKQLQVLHHPLPPLLRARTITTVLWQSAKGSRFCMRSDFAEIRRLMLSPCTTFRL